MNNVFKIATIAILSTLSASVLQTANAATFTFNLNNAPDGTVLDPYLIDGAGQTIGSTTYSTNNNNVGQIWSSIGISITAVNSSNNPARVGLFQSNCLPNPPVGTPIPNTGNFTTTNFGSNTGTSNNGFTVPCNTTASLGDPDLATGKGNYGSVSYDTPSQGVLLIIEENAGNGIPDDLGNGGKIRINFDRSILSSVKIGEITLVDDVRGSILVTYTDGTSNFNPTFNLTEENELSTYNPTDGQVDYLEVDFSGRSGAIGSVFFTEFNTVAVEVSEPSKILLSLFSLGLILFSKKHLQSEDYDS